MKKFLLLLTACVTLNACNLIKREAGYPGGNVGYVADRYALFAKGQEQRVNRHLVTLALLAPLMAETVSDSSEARLSSERIKQLYRTISKLDAARLKCALPEAKKSEAEDFVTITSKPCSTAEAASLEGTALTFESLSFEVSESLYDALKQSFDNLDVQANADRLLALDATEILRTILKARHIIPVIQDYLSTYRDVSIIFGLSILDSCGTTKSCKDVKDAYSDLVNRKRTPSSEVASKERPIRDLLKAGEIELNEGLDWKLKPIHRISLLQHVNRSCRVLDALAKADDTSYKGCEVELDVSKAKASKSDVQQAVERIFNKSK